MDETPLTLQSIHAHLERLELAIGERLAELHEAWQAVIVSNRQLRAEQSRIRCQLRDLRAPPNAPSPPARPSSPSAPGASDVSASS